MVQGKVDFELEIFSAYQADEWERASSIVAMIFNTRFGAESVKEPKEFNPIHQRKNHEENENEDGEQEWERELKKRLAREKESDGG
jgi:hypothetical protein